MSMRFSLRQLLATIAFVAVACAALAQPGYWWHSTIVTATVLVFIAMSITALIGRQPAQAFAVGWLVLAVGYLSVVLGPWMGQQLAPQLLTSKGLARLEAAWHKDPSPPVFGQIADYDGDGVLDLYSTYTLYGQPAGGSGTILWNVNTGSTISAGAPQAAANHTIFQSTAHWLAALVLGHLGGLLAMTLAWRRDGNDAAA